MFKFASAATGIALAAAGPALAVGITGEKASSDFAFKYEADVLPDAAGLGFVLYDPNGVVGNTVSVTSGVLTINTDTQGLGSDSIWYQMNGGNWNPSFLGDFTMEVRALVRPNNSGSFGAAVGMGDSNSAGFFQMFTNKVNMEGIDISTAANNDAFHVFRIVSISDGSSAGQLFRVYRDGAQIGSDVAQITDFAGFLLRVGDFISGSAEINLDIDYLRWDTSGAWAPPVPEPATLGLTTLGALAVISRRARR